MQPCYVDKLKKEQVENNHCITNLPGHSLASDYIEAAETFQIVALHFCELHDQKLTFAQKHPRIEKNALIFFLSF